MTKFKINAKAVEGRERKAAAAEAKKLKKLEEEEAKISKEWQVGSKDNSKKAEEEAKRLEKLQKKRERERLEAIEAASIKTKVRPELKEKAPSLSSASVLSSASSIKPESYLKLPLEPLNRPTTPLSVTTSNPDFESLVSEYSASNLEDAVSLLEGTNASADKLTMERHPERRMKAAFAAYEQREMPILKIENPNLRLSQLREILKKNWQKAPENPFNQATISYRATREEEIESAKSHIDKQMDRFRA